MGIEFLINGEPNEEDDGGAHDLQLRQEKEMLEKRMQWELQNRARATTTQLVPAIEEIQCAKECDVIMNLKLQEHFQDQPPARHARIWKDQ